MDGSDDDDDDGIVGGAEQEVPADLHAAPILRAAQIQGPDEPLMLAAEGADDGGAHPLPANTSTNEGNGKLQSMLLLLLGVGRMVR